MIYSIYTREEKTERKKLIKLCDVEAENEKDAYNKIAPFFITSKQGRAGYRTVLDNTNYGRQAFYRLIIGKQKEANGYFFSTNNKATSILINGSTAFRINPPPVMDDFIVFDIETTHLGDREITEGIKRPQSVAYLYGFKRYSFNTGKAVESYRPYYGKNAIEEVRKYLKELDAEAKRNKSYFVIYAHNLIVELTELIQNIFTFDDIVDLQENAFNNLYRGSKSKPIVFQYGNLKFCDSLALLNKSLEKVGVDVGLIKNEQNKTYHEKWFLGSDLPQWELDYNENDLDITAAGVIKLLKKTGFLSLRDVFKNNVVTATSLSKYINKKIITKEQLDEKRLFATHNLPKKENGAIDIQRLKLWQEYVFKGGLCYANYLLCYILINKVLSLDVASLYPSEMLLRQYPYSLAKYKGKKPLEFLLDMHRVNLNKYNSFLYDFKKMLTLKNYKHIPYFFIAIVTLENVKRKQFSNNNVMLSMADSKAFTIENAVTDGEKIVSCDSVTLAVTSIELLTYSLTYDFTITSAQIDCYTDKWRFLSDADIIILNHHGNNKFKSAQLLDAVKNGAEYHNLLKDLNINVAYFNSLSDSEKIDYADDLKQYFKQTGLNNQYGMNVQRIVNDTFYFDYEKVEYLTAEEMQGVTNHNTTDRNYIAGICITAYSRLDLITMFLNIEKKTRATFVYCDTDSLKFAFYDDDNKRAVYCLTAEYNAFKQRYREELEYFFNSTIDTKDKINLHNFGDWERDGEYEIFKTLGTKTYCYYDGKTIHKTIAGIKKPFDKFLNNEATRLGVSAAIDKYIAPNMLLSHRVCGHMTTRQPERTEYINDSFIDDNGDLIPVKQYCSYTITERSKWVQELTVLNKNKSHFDLCKSRGNFKTNMFEFTYVK